VTIDGNDPLLVYQTVKEAADRARGGGGPTLIEAETYRYYAHTSDDDDRLYRSREEVESGSGAIR
jgi:2-oxoisovalerate dehydrogenase E1 component alpha subunit